MMKEPFGNDWWMCFSEFHPAIPIFVGIFLFSFVFSSLFGHFGIREAVEVKVHASISIELSGMQSVALVG